MAPEKRTPPRRPARRRSLSSVRAAASQPFRLSGEPEDAARLERMVSIPKEASVRRLTHGFHDYPAKLHPLWAKRGIALFAEKDALVLDPFVGSGTVMVEAFASG